MIPVEELGKRLEPANIVETKRKLPEYTDDESFKKAIKDVINATNKEECKKGEQI